MTDPIILTGTKTDADRLRWLQKAVSKDEDRPNITGIYIEETLAAATDGFRLHVTPRPECVLDTGIINEADGRAFPVSYKGIFRAFAKVISERFPRYKEIIPQKQEVAGRAVVNARYLSDAIAGLGHVPVEITIYKEEKITLSSKPGYIELRTQTDNPRYALIMPMHNVEWLYDPLENRKKE